MTPLTDDGPEEQPPLQRYLDTIRRHAWVVALSVLLCTAAAALYVFTADPVYEANADMLVTPVPDEQAGVLGLGLIRRASDPTRDVTTAARLIGNVEVARRAARSLRSQSSPEALLARVSVEPVAQSSIVAITAQGSTPRQARDLANAFGNAAVQERTEQLYRELDPAIAKLRERIQAIAAAGATGADATALGEDLAALETLRSGPDPTLRLETPAAEPTAPVSPRTRLAIVGGAFAGLLLGIAGAFLLTALDPRDQREDRLRDLGLPVLANVPDTRRTRGSRHAFDEAFRFLRTMIRFAAPDPSRPYTSIAITSPSEQEGKTTTSYQLAFAALEAGQSVLLVEADPYRPGLRRVIDVPGDRLDGALQADADAPGLSEYLAGTATLQEVIQPTAVPGLQFVAAGELAMQSITGLLERAHGRAFVREFAEQADFVILDCPPVGPRSDAVLIAAEADGVVLVVDLERSSEKEVTDAVHRLRSARSHLLGVVLNRDDSPAAEYDYQEVPVNGRGSGRRRPLLFGSGRSA